MPRRLAWVVVLMSSMCGRTHSEEPRSSGWDVPSNVVLAPSNSVTDPASSMNGLHIIDDLDRPTSRASDADHGNWLIAPLPFRNELLGAGLVLGLGYLYGDKDRGAESKHSIAGVGGMYAEGGSWAAIGAHRGYWSDERYRTTVGAVTGEIRYDIALDIASTEQNIPLFQSLSAGTVEAALRLGEKTWIGLGLLTGSTKVNARNPEVALPEELGLASIDLSTLRLSAEYDTRDSDLYPRSGRYVDALVSLSRTQLGSEYDYEILEIEWNTYVPLADSHVLAGRVAATVVEGDAPFFAKAWFGSDADLRGYTPGRYIGESMVAAQAEWRWTATPRWGFVAFAGAGKVSGALGDIETDDWLPAIGAGVRFRMLRALPLNLRADFGWGRDDSTFTLAVGEAF